MALLVEKTTQVITNTRSMTFPRATPMLLQHLLHPRSRHCHYCTERALNWGPDGGPNLIVDDNSDATFLIHEGVKVGKLYEKTDELLDPNSTDNAEFQIVLTIIRDGLYQMQPNDTFLFPAINVNDFVTNNKVMSLFPQI
ncbi:Adenosylhomocysteinase [Glycine max]|nr:Adenosylhomocysteinase [Glycine max]